VLVTDGNQRSTLAVVRSLGKAGVAVTVAESTRTSLAGSSRYCAKRLCYPPPDRNAADFLACLRQELRMAKYELLLPMTDVSVQLLAAARDTFSPLVGLPFPSKDRVARVQDKREMLRLARTIGIAYPNTYMLSEDEQLEEVAAKMTYPAVLKPRFSRFLKDGKLMAGTVLYASDRSSLLAEYRRLHALIPFPMVQERIEGEGQGIFLLMWNGELRAAFAHRRLREKPPWGGVSVLSESIALNRDLVEQSVALLNAAGWQGVAMVEFKVDRRDGRPKLMEVNGRFWGSLQLAIDAGIDFPLMLYRLALGEKVPSMFEYKIGIKSRWLLGDLDHLLIRLRRSGPPGVSMAGQKSKWRAVLDFVKLCERDTRYEVQRLDDLSPAWFEIRKYIGEILWE